ncbi:uncharacterized protein N7473_007997 [Penicillium subrubescens]|uniref:uncharacterized protein n=1 Tax=Penicillium subrubescens TaxID=1316194 RepID=UPI002545240E|nr:uncharacterized protein N7473_007997 [Penicillium subrubescens]KAJ5891769.1 hypothetical protein N7473_007997 [Penicillium subrubescens]
MKFTRFTLSLALTSMVSAAAIPALPGADGVVGGLGGAAEGVVAGVAGGHLKRQTQVLDPVHEEVTNANIDNIEHVAVNTLGGFKRQVFGVDTIKHDLDNDLAPHLKRQLEAVQPVTEGVASSLNGVTGIAGSAVGTAESTGQGAVGTVESTVAGAAHVKRELPGVGTVKQTLSDTLGHAVKRQLEVVQPVTEGVASSLNGGTGIIGSAAGTGIIGSAAGTAESTGQGAVGTAESTVAGAGHLKRQLEAVQPVTEGVASSLNGGTGIIGSAAGTAESTGQGAVGTVESTVAGLGSVAKRQLGNLPATASQTGTDIMAGLSGNPSGIYGALANLQMLVNAGKISPSDISNMPAAVQRVIANLAVA